MRAEPSGVGTTLDDLIDLFGWEDKTPLHAVLHVRNAVNNLRADLAFMRSEAKRVAEKHDRLQERLTAIERANVDRWKDGYAAAERQIAAWLDQPCDMSGHDDRGCPACSFRADIANAVRDGKHRPANRENP